MSVTVTGTPVSAATGTSGASTLTVSATVPADAEYLLVFVPMRYSGGAELTTHISSVTANGTGMSALGVTPSSTQYAVHGYGLNAPPTGTYNVVVTFASGIGRAGVIVIALKGTHTTTPVGTVVSATGNDAAPSVVAAGETDGLVIAGVMCNEPNNPQTNTISPGTGATELIADFGFAIGTLGGRASAYSEPGAASVTIDAVLGSATSWRILAVPIAPAAVVSADGKIRIIRAP